MFALLFVVSFLLALGVAFGVAWISKEPIESILHRFFAVHLSDALSKYLRFAIFIVGVTAGARIRALEEYIAAPAYNKTALNAALTTEFWTLEMYRTIIESLEGILWLLLVSAFLIVVAVAIIRKAELKQLLPEPPVTYPGEIQEAGSPEAAGARLGQNRTLTPPR
jgi:hypothetical protein